MTGVRSPSVLFVCVRNGGKSQMAAGLMRTAAPEVAAHSAGTDPGPSLNAPSVQVLAEVGVDITGETPTPIDPRLLESVDLVIALGREAQVEVPDGVEARVCDTDEPSERGIDGIERMRLVRDDITTHVDALAAALRAPCRRSPCVWARSTGLIRHCCWPGGTAGVGLMPRRWVLRGFGLPRRVRRARAASMPRGSRTRPSGW